MSDLELNISTSIDWQVIEELNLELIKLKLMDKKEGLGWSSDRCNKAEKWYKRFLYLCGKYPDSPLVPLGDIDKFWHQHILYTKKYDNDCNQIFGYLLHHFPYFGMLGVEDAANLRRAVEETSKIFENEYGESPLSSRSSYIPSSPVCDSEFDARCYSG